MNNLNSSASKKSPQGTGRRLVLWVPYLPPSPNRIQGSLGKTLGAKKAAKDAWSKALRDMAGQDQLGEFNSLRAGIESLTMITSLHRSNIFETRSLVASYQDYRPDRPMPGSAGSTGRPKRGEKKASS